MRKYVPAAAFLALLAVVVLAGPKDTSKSKSATDGKCPFSTAKCSDCPDTPTDCPSKGKQATKPTAAKPGTVVVRCENGTTRVIDVAKYTKAGKYADYNGKRYYFGCPQCAKEFKKDPAAYAKSHQGFAIPVANKRKASS